MRILITSWNVPGYAPNVLFDFLRSRDYDVQKITAPAKHERRFIPGISHLQNIRQIHSEAKGYYDIAIAPDPAYVYALNSLKRKGIIGKVIYWRLDFYPKKYPGPLNQAYQALERYALESCDEVWSISDPEIPLIHQSLGKATSKTIYVPYLLPHTVESDNSERGRVTMWMGPDLDNSRLLCEEATRSLNIEFNIADYSIDQYRVSDDKLTFMLHRARVGLSPYRPDVNKQSSKYYCDASRIRRFLASGIPVVTTRVAPTHTTILEEKCGIVCPWDTESIKSGIEYCLENFDELSANAIKAANKYTYSNWFSEYKVLDPSRLSVGVF